LNKDDKGLLRQYYQPEKHGVSISPYEPGHLRVIAALASSVFGGTNYTPQVSIHDRIAVTNFVKFSFYRLGKSGQHMDANPPTEIYDDMWRLYGERETCILEPDIVIAVGDDVYSTLRQNMAGSAKLLKIPFPGRLNLNSRWVPLGKRLIIEQNHNPVEDISELDALMKGTPDPKGKIRQAIRTDWYYFTSMKEVFVQSF